MATTQTEMLRPLIAGLKASAGLMAGSPATVTVENNEYLRGQVELIIETTDLGLNSDDIDTVAKIVLALSELS